MDELPGKALPVIASHGAACWGCGEHARGALRMRFTDDGTVTRARAELGPEWAGAGGEARAGLVLAVMEEALRYAGHARLGTDVMTDGQSQLFARGVRTGAPFVVEAWPGRRSGMGFFFYARIVQDGVERAHVETWLGTMPEAEARRAATPE